jgi:lipoprotein-anchoring transpeptidase ErfK/SrfK
MPQYWSIRSWLIVIAFVAGAVSLAGSQAPRPASAADPESGAVDWLEVQTLLDKAAFSPGEIDAKGGENTAKALRAFQASRRLEPTGQADPPTLEALRAASDGVVLRDHVVSAADVAGPFTPQVPDDLMEQSTLPALGYADAAERLAERFHTSPRLLRELNPGATFVEGEILRVPAVAPLELPAYSGTRKPEDAPSVLASLVEVVAETGTLTVRDAEGAILLHAPVSTGSANDPLPAGEWTVRSVLYQPKFHYNPALFWDADPTHAKTVIPPGPNNPVGLIWVDIDKEHWGLHGTPEPSRIGYAQSHGCVRLTNWDAVRLAGLVDKGTRVLFQ